MSDSLFVHLLFNIFVNVNKQWHVSVVFCTNTVMECECCTDNATTRLLLFWCECSACPTIATIIQSLKSRRVATNSPSFAPPLIIITFIRHVVMNKKRSTILPAYYCSLIAIRFGKSNGFVMHPRLCKAWRATKVDERRAINAASRKARGVGSSHICPLS